MKKNNKGFTLAELLIVVAIIAVLVAIAIPVFTSQLEKSREATDLANVRSAYATVVTKYMGDGSATSVKVKSQQGVSGWNHQSGVITTMVEGSVAEETFSAKINGDEYTVCIDTNGKVTIG